MSKIAALDIGDVCISIHPDRIVKALGISALSLLPTAKDIMRQTETGTISSEKFLDRFEEYTKHKFSRAELVRIWNSMLGESLPGMADAVRKAIANGWRFIYFSNTSALHMAHFLSTNDFCHLVTGAVFSYEAGAMKPDAAIYEAFEAQYGVPDVYFDDRKENIDAALKRGWNAVHFKSPEQVRIHCR